MGVILLVRLIYLKNILQRRWWHHPTRNLPEEMSRLSIIEHHHHHHSQQIVSWWRKYWNKQSTNLQVSELDDSASVTCSCEEKISRPHAKDRTHYHLSNFYKHLTQNDEYAWSFSVAINDAWVTWWWRWLLLNFLVPFVNSFTITYFTKKEKEQPKAGNYLQKFLAFLTSKSKQKRIQLWRLIKETNTNGKRLKNLVRMISLL